MDATSGSQKAGQGREGRQHPRKGGKGVRSTNGRGGAGQPTPHGTHQNPCYGALDLGTNNCRLLLARPTATGFAIVDAFSRIVRLGEGLGSSGQLKPEAMNRTIDALRVCANKLHWHSVKRKRLIATEACRFAENGAEFISRVAQETGLELEIINRETEALLAAAGAESLIDDAAHSAIVFDIGGGSTEVMWVERRAGGGHVRAWISLAAGVVTLSERHGGGREVSDSEFMAMRADVGLMLQPFLRQVESIQQNGPAPDHLLGTSGTVTTIAGVQLGLRHYDRSVVDGCWLEADDATQVISTMRTMSYADRSRNGCIGRERADLVLAGCAIFDEIRAAFPGRRIRVADRGLREGILSQLMKADGFSGRRQ